MRIGIYGGSFNPIHRGHTSLASSLVRQRLVDEVWLMVSPQNPLKVSACGTSHATHCGTSHTTYDDRVEMARLATRDIRGVEVSDFERNLPCPSYTVTTLRELSRTYPQHEFVLIIGEDNWQNFHRWYKAEEIIKDYEVLVFHRTGCNIPPGTSGTLPNKAASFVATKLYPISSTEIRTRLATVQQAEGAKSPEVWSCVKGMLNHRVLRYILRHALYRD